jgi:branched-chain amino acid transport system substrate-binding protein
MKMRSRAFTAVLTLGALLAVGLTPGLASAKPSGDPVKIGVIYTADVSGLELTALLRGAEAAAEHLNASEDGIGGRPVEIVPCNDKADPAQDVACAQQFVDEGVVAVAGGAGTWGANGLGVLAEAGIPFIGSPFDNPEFLSPTSYPIVGGSLTGFPALAEYFIDKGIEKASIVYADLAVGKIAADALLGDPLRAAGVSVVQVPEKLGAPDFTAAVVKANESDPDVLFVLFAADDTARAVQAASEVGVTAAVAMSSASAELETVRLIDPAILKTATFASETLWYEPKDPEAKIFRKALKKYGDGEKPGAFSANSFAVLMTLKTIADSLPEITAATVLEALKAAEGVHVFMGTELNISAPAELLGTPTHVSFTDGRIIRFKNGKFVDANNHEWINGLD